MSGSPSPSLFGFSPVKLDFGYQVDDFWVSPKKPVTPPPTNKYRTRTSNVGRKFEPASPLDSILDYHLFSPSPARTPVVLSPPVDPQLRMDRLTKENFDLKLKIYMLEGVLDRNSPEGLRATEARKVKLDELAKRLVAKEKELNAKSTDIDTRVRDTERAWASRNEELEDEISDLQRQNSALQQELKGKYKESQAEDAKLEHENKELQEENTTLVQENKQLRKENVDLRKKQRQTAKEVRDLDDEVRNLEIELDTAREIQQAKDDAARRLKEENEEAVRQVQALQGSMEQQTLSADWASRGLHDQIARLEGELQDNIAGLESSQTEHKTYETAVDAVLTEVGVEIADLRTQVEEKDALLARDKAQHELWQQTQLHISQTVSQKDSRISELEASQEADRRKLATLEQVARHQLGERNRLLLAIWKRFAHLCGSDWQHQNNLVNNHIPTEEVIGKMLPDFSRNLLAAVKTVESRMNDHRTRVDTVERNLYASYQDLEKKVDGTSKRLRQLEVNFQSKQLSGTFMAVPELAKLRGENRLLKSELARIPRAMIPDISESTEQRWSHRVRELEKRLKHEREARLLDRAGAKQRIEELETKCDSLKASVLVATWKGR